MEAAKSINIAVVKMPEFEIDKEIKKLKIGVLMGGWSEEREISLKSGYGVLNSLKRMGFNAIGIDITKESIKKLNSYQIDTAYIMLHGTPGEDGLIQSYLELMGIKYTGSNIKSSMLSMDKLLSKFLFIHSNIPTPQWWYVERIEDVKKIYKKLPYPVIAKPRAEGSSIGVAICDTKEELFSHIEKNLNLYKGYIIEKFIEGIIVTVGIVGDEILPILELVPKKRYYDYEAKYTKGMTEFIIPARLDKEVYYLTQQDALKAHKAIGCKGFSRVDLIVENNTKPLVLEVNSIPGMTEISDLPAQAKSKGISYDELVYRILEYSLKS